MGVRSQKLAVSPDKYREQLANCPLPTAYCILPLLLYCPIPYTLYPIPLYLYNLYPYT